MNTTSVSYFFVALILAFFATTILVSLARWSVEFSRELHALNIEIKRCTGAERNYYVQKRKLLILSIIPFIKY